MEKLQFCPHCNKPLAINVHFCSMCGEAISDDAKILEKEKNTRAKLELLQKLIDEVTDINSLKIIQSHLEILK